MKSITDVLNDDDILLTKNQVKAARGDVTDMAIYRQVKAGWLPKPLKINSRCYWRKSDIVKAAHITEPVWAKDEEDNDAA